MLPDRVSSPGPLTYESGALPIALRGPAELHMDLQTMETLVKLRLIGGRIIWVCNVCTSLTIGIFNGICQSSR